MRQTAQTWRIALAAVLCLFACFASGRALCASSSSASVEIAGHQDEPTCPDRDHDGKPCGPLCPCTCCPGHGMVPADVPSPSVPVVVSTLSTEVDLVSAEELDPILVVSRVFHPPRA
ncbi:MAG: hypothetical protein JW940_26460 [Polyangiaceae bacterium]|nr:hypothetical protein [Polyangiaceae bacterium]